jgi:hypothetical protein
MTRPALIVAVCLALAGCASYVWYRPDATPEIAARDQTECDYQARYLARDYLLATSWWWGGGAGRYRDWPFPPESGLAVEQRIFARCMEFKGYRLQKVEQE